jgi:beta-glucosidase
MNIDLKARISKLTLEEKIRLVTGEDFWTTWAIPSIELRKMVVSDGPSGVRGQLWDERSTSLSLPSATAFASTWNRSVMNRVGEVMAFEARRKGVDVVLGPTINLHRSPLGGRHFEAFSEDAVLSGHLASSFIKGIQGQGVGGCLKHFVANDAETDRHTVNNVLDEATLRELYALPFEIAVRDANPWTIMSAYNRVNGPKMAASPLLNSVLKDEWKWDGMVVSDWTGVTTTVETGREGNDLEMPGPFGQWGEKLLAAVNSGEVAESAIDAKVERILRLAYRVGKLADAEMAAYKKFTDQQLNEAARSIGAESIVLVKNENKNLPIESVKQIAVMGAHARFGRGQGGGSATVFPVEVISPLQGLIENAPAETTVRYTLGVNADPALVVLDKNFLRNPSDNQPGCRVEVIAAGGKILMTEHRLGGFFNWATQPWMSEYEFIRVSAIFTAQQAGEYQFGIGMVGNYTVKIGDEIHQGFIPMNSDDLGEYILNPPTESFSRTLYAGEEILLQWEYPNGSLPVPLAAFLIGFREPERTKEQEIAEAVSLAQQSDVAIVFVGTTAEIESEGHDRKNIELPDGQDQLVAAVAKVAKRTVVVVNAGSPVEMPWFKDVDSVVLSWFGGQQMGNALADVIYGKVNPSGHLPTTWAKVMSDLPVVNTTPENGELHYKEGKFIGYRAWRKAKRTPLLPFGFGLSYTTFNSKLISADRNSARVEVTNTGDRSGAEVLQIYASRKEGENFERRLAGFAKVELKAGEKAEVSIEIEPLVFKKFDQSWRENEGQWSLTLAPNAFAEGESTPI